MSAEADDIIFLSRLSNGKATQEDRDKALVEALVEVRAIRRDLWKPEDLMRFIREQHSELCAHCTKSFPVVPVAGGEREHKEEGLKGPLMFVLKILACAGIGGFVIALLCLGVKFAEIVQAASQFMPGVAK